MGDYWYVFTIIGVAMTLWSYSMEPGLPRGVVGGLGITFAAAGVIAAFMS